MLNPPLYIELTHSDSGETEAILLSRIHTMRDFTDTEKFQSGTIIRTWNELGILTPQGIGMAFNEVKVREKKKEIFAKMKKVMQDCQRMMARSMDEFNDSEDDPYNLFA